MYEVEKIIGRKTDGNKLFYLIKWKGFSIDQSTYEPIENLKNCVEMIEEYEEELDKVTERKTIFRLTKYLKNEEEKFILEFKEYREGKLILASQNSESKNNSVTKSIETFIDNPKKNSVEFYFKAPNKNDESKKFSSSSRKEVKDMIESNEAEMKKAAINDYKNKFYSTKKDSLASTTSTFENKIELRGKNPITSIIGSKNYSSQAVGKGVMKQNAYLSEDKSSSFLGDDDEDDEEEVQPESITENLSPQKTIFSISNNLDTEANLTKDSPSKKQNSLDEELSREFQSDSDSCQTVNFKDARIALLSQKFPQLILNKSARKPSSSSKREKGCIFNGDQANSIKALDLSYVKDNEIPFYKTLVEFKPSESGKQKEPKFYWNSELKMLDPTLLADELHNLHSHFFLRRLMKRTADEKRVKYARLRHEKKIKMKEEQIRGERINLAKGITILSTSSQLKDN